MITETLDRMGVGAATRAAPQLRGLTGSSRRRFRTLVQYAIRAPSNHNTQPWLFRMSGDALDLCADRRRALPVVDPDDRELIMSCGAALFHLRLAIRQFSHAADVELLPDPHDPDLLARVRIGAPKPPTVEDELLFDAIPLRHTNRRPFQRRPLPSTLLDELREAAAMEGATLRIVESSDEKEFIAALIAEADHRQAADPAFRRELAAWIHPNRDWSRDGMPGYAHGLRDLSSRIAPFLVRTFDWGNGQAAKDRQLAEGSPALLILGTDEDTPLAWLWAGQALARILLLACAVSVSASFLNQPVEVPELRTSLALRLGLDGVPQLLLRMGYGSAAMPTPRRSIDEVFLPY